MFVDDSSFMRSILKGIILKEPFELAGEATTGKEAVELYRDNQTRPRDHGHRHAGNERYRRG